MSRATSQQDSVLFRRHLKRRRFWLLLTSGSVLCLLGFLIVTAYLSIPKLLDRRAKKKARITAADLDATKNQLKPSERARLGAAIKNERVPLPNLTLDPTLRARLGLGRQANYAQPVDITLAERVIQPEARELAIMNAAVDATIEGYRSAASPEEKSAYVIDAERVLPLMRRFYAREADNLDPMGNLVRRTYYELHGAEYAIDRRRLEDQADRLVYVALRKTERTGKYKIDWESLVGYGEMSWDELLSTRPEKPVLFRCYADRADYHNFGYSDPTRWSCIRLLNHRSGETIYGYVRKGTRADASISDALRVRSPATLTLRISIPGNIKAGHRQVRIDEVIQNTWLMVKPGEPDRQPP